MTLKDRRAARRSSRVHGAITGFFDPDREHPFLKKAFEMLAPIAISFLTAKLPTWLSGIDLTSLNPDADPNASNTDPEPAP